MVNRMRKLVIASRNQGKIKEIKEYLQGFPFKVVGMDDYPDLDPVIEDGETFKENALKKARARARETGELTLADDSGLEVDHLNGRPGVYSARFAGPRSTDIDNNNKLLSELTGLPVDKRSARFRAVLALVDPDSGEEITVDGKCEGYIIDHPQGENGFGYDPVFYLPELDCTMAELPLNKKNQISHRAKGLKGLREVLNDRY